MQPAIRIENLTKRFGDLTAVDGLELEIPEGSIFGFLGANGAGKTTTLRMIAGLARPTHGSIEVGGIASTSGPSYRRQIGYLCQEPAFYGWMTGREVLRYAAGFFPEFEGSAKAEVERLLSVVGLADAAARRCKDYSGGMRQRLGIAAALVGHPRVLLLDEPATGLDPLGRRDVLELMESLRESTTIFYSTHILDDVQRVSDRVAVIDHGKLLASDRTEDLLAGQGRNRLRVELVGATPATADQLRAMPGVVTVSRPEITPDGRAFQVEFAGSSPRAIQEEITRIAAASGLVVIEARPTALDLEEVFLNLVDTGVSNGERRKETAA
jgi:ABC-2 type transport system ATP-binding protein